MEWNRIKGAFTVIRWHDSLNKSKEKRFKRWNRLHRKEATGTLSHHECCSSFQMRLGVSREHVINKKRRLRVKRTSSLSEWRKALPRDLESNCRVLSDHFGPANKSVALLGAAQYIDLMATQMRVHLLCYQLPLNVSTSYTIIHICFSL